MAIHANFTLQLIVVSTPRALIKLIVDFILASEGALTFSDILSDSLLNDLIVSFVSSSELIVDCISNPEGSQHVTKRAAPHIKKVHSKLIAKIIGVLIS